MDSVAIEARDSGRVELEVIEGGKSGGETESRGSPGWARRLRSRAKTVAQRLETGYMEMARILYEVYDCPIDGDPDRGPIYQAWGFKTFKEYVELELGMHGRHAERLRAIWYVMEVELTSLDPVTKKDLVNVGMSKLRELVKILDINNARAWADLAARVSYPVLCDAIRQAKEAADIQALEEQEQVRRDNEVVLGELVAPSIETLDSGVEVLGGMGVVTKGSPSFEGLTLSVVPPSEIEKPTFEHFALYPDQHLNVKLALKKASELSGSDKKSHNLDLICTDFLATNDITGKNREQARIRLMGRIEKIFGVQLIAFDLKEEEIVYGMQTLARMVEMSKGGEE